jgi:hypothetical protein
VAASAAQQDLEGRLELPVTSLREFDGIISYLSAKCGVNVHDKGIVLITASSARGHPPQICADFANSLGHCSTRAPNQWICWDFQKRIVIATHYMTFLMSAQEWIIEGSVDGMTWTEIDRRENAYSLAKRVYAIARPGGYRCFRLSVTGPKVEPSGEKQEGFDVSKFEFFGTLFE